MKYMLLIYSDEKIWSDGERERCFAESTELCHELEERGQLVSASPLHFISSATSVRVRDGRSIVTDGPFAETREQLGGYFIVDVENLDEAIKIAERIPPAKKGTVEIRPMLDLPNLPQRR